MAERDGCPPGAVAPRQRHRQQWRVVEIAFRTGQFGATGEGLLCALARQRDCGGDASARHGRGAALHFEPGQVGPRRVVVGHAGVGRNNGAAAVRHVFRAAALRLPRLRVPRLTPLLLLRRFRLLSLLLSSSSSLARSLPSFFVASAIFEVHDTLAELGVRQVSCLLFTVIFYANPAHNLTRSP